MPYYPPAGAGGGTGGAGAILERRVATLVTPSLALGQSFQGRIGLGRSYQILELATSQPARLRLYVSATGQAADLARPPGASIVMTNGVVLDFITSAERLAWPLTPVVSGSSLESPPVPDIPITVEPFGQAGPVTVTMTYFQLEA